MLFLRLTVIKGLKIKKRMEYVYDTFTKHTYFVIQSVQKFHQYILIVNFLNQI